MFSPKDLAVNFWKSDN